jgi:hypothetical protein
MNQELSRLELAELKAANLKIENTALRDKLRFLKSFVEASKAKLDLPEAFLKLIDDDFWDLI